MAAAKVVESVKQTIVSPSKFIPLLREQQFNSYASAILQASFSGVPTYTLLDGKKIPWLAWGNGTGDAKKTATESGAWALETGIRHIDTAQGYENEPETGLSITKSTQVKREDVWITTKLSQPGGDPSGTPLSLDEVRESVHGSVRRLGSIPDLLLLHNPFIAGDTSNLPAFWKILEDMKDRGELTASLGVSNFRPQDLEAILKVTKYKPVVNQLEYHPFVLTHLQPILDICSANNIVIESFGPLTPILRHPSKGGPLKPILDKIAKRLSDLSGKDVDQAGALLQWYKAKGVVAVTASGNKERIKKLAEAQYLPDLTKEEVDEIEQVGRKIHFRFYDEHLSKDFPAPDLPKDI